MLLNIQHAKAKSEQRLQQQSQQGQQQQLQQEGTLVVAEKLPGKCHAHNLLKDSRKCWTNNVCRWNLFAFIVELENCKTKLPNWGGGKLEGGGGHSQISWKKCVTWQSNRAIDKRESFIIPFNSNVRRSERVHWIINLYSATPAIPPPLTCLATRCCCHKSAAVNTSQLEGALVRKHAVI